ncbi:MAG: VOC family protein [Spongiibacteraceae bacterium]
MTSIKSRNTRIMQNSWVVNDLRQAAENWIRLTGIGPFFLVEGIELEDQLYRGKATDVKASFALAQAGDIQIELVCQHNDAPSAYRDTFAAGQQGFHHMALYCQDYDGDLNAYLQQGVEVAFSGSSAGKRFCYIDTTASLGYMMELIEHSPAQAEFFQRIRAAAVNWQGDNPLRPAF